MTAQEVKLWVHLRTWKDRGFHFRRQAPKSGHIVDFACLKKNSSLSSTAANIILKTMLVVTMLRDRGLSDDGYRVLRF